MSHSQYIFFLEKQQLILPFFFFFKQYLFRKKEYIGVGAYPGLPSAPEAHAIMTNSYNCFTIIVTTRERDKLYII